MCLDLSVISTLVDNTLHVLDEAMEPAANWILQLQDAREELSTIEVNVSATDALAFLRSTGKPFVLNLKANISSRFVSQDIVSAFSIFDPKKVPSITSPDIKSIL